MTDRPTVHLVDDDDAVRDSLAFLFRSARYEVASYASGQEALDGIAEGGGAACVVTDIRMPGMTGLELLNALRARERPLPVIVITGHGDVPLAVEAMRAGAADFIEKPFENEALLGAVQRALETSAPSEDAASSLVHERIGRLSQRERQVLEGLVEGRLNKTIAFELGISVRTVEVYRAKLMAKMQADTFADLVRMTVQAGAVSS